MISILFLELFTPHNPQFAILLQKNRDKGLHKVVFMSGVLMSATMLVERSLSYFSSRNLLFSASANVILLLTLVATSF
jgi:hypothetical protein